MNNHNYHHAAGLPEWADQKIAEETCDLAGLSPIDVPVKRQEAPEVESYRLAINAYWLQAMIAIKKGDKGRAKTLAAQAIAIEHDIDPMLLAVVGLKPRDFPKQLLEMGAEVGGLAGQLRQSVKDALKPAPQAAPQVAPKARTKRATTQQRKLVQDYVTEQGTVEHWDLSAWVESQGLPVGIIRAMVGDKELFSAGIGRPYGV